MTTSLDTILACARDHRDSFLRDLVDYLRIPSISAQPDHAGDVRRAAEWLSDHLRGLGLSAQVLETGTPSDAGHPVVYAEWLGAGPGRPTLLVYGHYDVQPPDPVEEWLSPPFAPAVRNGALYARGASDDKGQHLAHVKAVESTLKATGTLPINVKFLIEGEEEIGGAHLGQFVAAHADRLSCDAIAISDGSLVSLSQPALVYGLRGLIYFEVEARCAAHDLHSGSYGGNVQNPLMALARILAQLKDEAGRVTVPGFYQDARALDPAERAELAAVPLTEADIVAETGAPGAFGDPDYTIAERMGARPTLEINGLWGGYTGLGAKTVLPATAHAKISCRLVPHQEPAAVLQRVIDEMRRLAPPATELTFRQLQSGAPGVLIDRSSPYLRAAAQAARDAYDRDPIWMLEGGSIPVVGDFQAVLGKPIILLGFGLPDDCLHAPNEKLALACYEKGIEASIRLIQALAAKRE